jgi:hypothetical protein
VCVGFPGGKVVELTENKVTYPSGDYGSAVFVDGCYISLINE